MNPPPCFAGVLPSCGVLPQRREDEEFQTAPDYPFFYLLVLPHREDAARGEDPCEARRWV